MTNHNATRFFLRAFIISTIATAVVGILTLAWSKEIDWIEIKVLLTTLIIACASLCGLACAGCLVRGHKMLPTAGLVLTGIATVFLLVGMWFEIDFELYWKVSICVCAFAIACAHMSMLNMANLAGGYRWAQLAAFQVVFGLAALVSVGAVTELMDRSENYWRITGVVGILVAAVTLLIPIFHFMSRDILAVQKAEADPLFVVEEEIAKIKKRLIELEAKRRQLLGREPIILSADDPK